MTYFVTKNCVYVTNPTGAAIREETLKRCYAMDGYKDLPLAEKNKIYDRVIVEVEKEIKEV